jgi:uncharacterized membrane protein
VSTVSDASSVAALAIDAISTWTRLVLGAAGVAIIAVGAAVAAMAIPAAMRDGQRFTQVRLDFARYLALALEFQLASDILETAIAPSWTRLGQLAAIAGIRTALNFFLGREMKEEWAGVGERGEVTARGSLRRSRIGEE